MARYPRITQDGVDTSGLLKNLPSRASNGFQYFVSDLNETLVYNSTLKRWTADDRTIYSTSPRFLFDDFKNAGRAASCISPVLTLAKGSAPPAAPIVTPGSAVGIVPLLTTKSAGTLAADGVQLSGPAANWLTSTAAYTFECRVGFGMTGASAGDALTAVQYWIGLTDTIALEAPATISSDTLTRVADNAVGFLFNAAMTTKTVRAVSINANTPNATDMTAATTKMTDALAPKHGNYYRFRINVATTGACTLYTNADDGTGWILQKTIALAVATTANLAPCIQVYPTSTAAEKTLTVDYLWVK